MHMQDKDPDKTNNFKDRKVENMQDKGNNKGTKKPTLDQLYKDLKIYEDSIKPLLKDKGIEGENLLFKEIYMGVANIEENYKIFNEETEILAKKTGQLIKNFPRTEVLLNSPNTGKVLSNVTETVWGQCTAWFHSRMALADVLGRYVGDDKDRQKIKELKAKFLEDVKDEKNHYIHRDVSDREQIEFVITQLNAYRNKNSKHLNKMEDIITSSIKNNVEVIAKPEIKDLINKDFLKAKKDLKDNQNNLIKKVQQILEEMKKEEKK